jgi:serine/threonine protein kinase
MDEHDPLIEKVIAGRYRIVRRLGTGAMGAVYLARHLIMGRHDAIKVLRGEVAGDAETVARFMRGARVVSGIRHPNVCTVYDCGTIEDGSPFLAMEFVEGETLKELLEREGALSVGRAAQIAADIADALEAAHDAGVIHRDLKPGNVMITSPRRGTDGVKVVDFDLAKETAHVDDGELTRVGLVIGTPEYMSPEQLTYDSLDGRSDIYSLAIVLFRMLTGRLPFRGSGYQDIAVDRLINAPLRLDEARAGRTFPPGLQEALDRALQRNVDDRYQSAAEFRHALMTVLAGHPASAVDPPTERPQAAESPQIAPTRVVQVGAPDRASISAGPRRAVRLTAGKPLVLAVPIALVLALAVSSLLRDQDKPLDPSMNGAASNEVGAPPSTAIEDASQPSAASSDAPSEAGGPAARANAQPDPGQRPIATVNHDPFPTDSAAIDSVLVRQLDAMQLGSSSAVSATAIRDTARTVWRRGENPKSLRAFAAYVLANVAHASRDRGECLLWMRHALDLSPANHGYERLRQICGDPGT